MDVAAPADVGRSLVEVWRASDKGHLEPGDRSACEGTAVGVEAGVGRWATLWRGADVAGRLEGPRHRARRDMRTVRVQLGLGEAAAAARGVILEGPRTRRCLDRLEQRSEIGDVQAIADRPRGINTNLGVPGVDGLPALAGKVGGQACPDRRQRRAEGGDVRKYDTETDQDAGDAARVRIGAGRCGVEGAEDRVGRRTRSLDVGGRHEREHDPDSGKAGGQALVIHISLPSRPRGSAASVLHPT